MMTDSEKEKTLMALEKIIDGEPLSTADFQRFINFLKESQINADIADQGKWAGLQVQLRSVLNERFMPKAGG